MSSTIPKSQLENILLFSGVVLGAAATFFTSQTTTIFGLSPFLLAVIAAAMSKALPSLAQDPYSYEDWVLFLGAFFGALSTGFTSNPAYAIWGVIFGFLVKAVLSFKGATRENMVEDSFLCLSVLAAGFGQVFGIPDLVNLALFLAAVSKAVPGLGPASAPAAQATG